ncbi:hypothetical protein [Agrobacterium rubi]|uniref:Uncharacterized protein n=1 Tax=Agrobacterium rubi TaxID=28099 RepID=A0AAE7UTJ9_9HYPH|nr:hypothetical protein [Agrobacterium rubi]NTE89565.1 hypothetical protein [Agrobacterium rubi]NTF05701.1 hypothetical protein [Agrobacterium rubi]NTF39701.1 hypothetical protein [Agrobacterium rubi]QTG03521.1 hypothetical protein G6M88_23985 [Agrobacterium rubi]
MHRRVIALRDKCTAHFGLGDGWNDDRVIFKDEEATYGVTSVHMRSAFNLELLNDMDSLLSVAIPHVEKLERARADELMKSVFATSEANRAIIGENDFDITAFFQNLPDKEAEFWRARASMIVTS